MIDDGQSITITWEELPGRPMTTSDLCAACRRPLGMNVTYEGDPGTAWHSGCYAERLTAIAQKGR